MFLSLLQCIHSKSTSQQNSVTKRAKKMRNGQKKKIFLFVSLQSKKYLIRYHYISAVLWKEWENIIDSFADDRTAVMFNNCTKINQYDLHKKSNPINEQTEKRKQLDQTIEFCWLGLFWVSLCGNSTANKTNTTKTHQ